MIDFTLPQLTAWIGTFLWPFIRIAAFIGSAPILGDPSIPVYFKVALAAILALAVAPAIGTPPTVSLASYEAIGILLEQMLVGLALGLIMRMVFAAVLLAGELVGLQMGLSFASFFDPANSGNTSVMARLFSVIATLVFVSVNGHLIVISGLASTFEMLPIGGERLDMNGIGYLVQYSNQIFTASLLLALPMVIALLTINLTMGILNRTAQQLSVFSVGFPITLSVGLALLTVVLPQTNNDFETLFMSGFTAMTEMIRLLSGA